MTPAIGRRLSSLELTRSFLSDRGSSPEFYEELALRAIESLPWDVKGRRVLDLGCGPGHYAHALEKSGAEVFATDLAVGELQKAVVAPPRVFASDARQLPFGDASFDGVFCSNILEHTPEPFAVLDDIARVLSPGGWGYVSWTNWLSPWGGHAIAPLHYLGPERGMRVYQRLFGDPKGHNLPFDGVWPTHIGDTLDYLDSMPELTLDGVVPRYYPSQRWIMKVPGLREVAAWNCVLFVRRTAETPSHQPSAEPQ